MRTWDVVKQLLTVAPSHRYLELLTPSTSTEHTDHAAALGFDRAEFLAYRTPVYEPYGPRPDLPTVDHIESMVPGELFDIVFVDPWHSMDDSRAVLRWGFGRVALGGFLVVHDCWPSALELLGDYPGRGASWCGDTWRAFQELARGQANSWCVINDDYGIGIIGPVMVPGVQSVVINTMSNPAAQWQWMSEHQGDPWLIAADDWQARIGALPGHSGNWVGSSGADR